jgi:hypothetical protein
MVFSYIPQDTEGEWSFHPNVGGIFRDTRDLASQ